MFVFFLNNIINTPLSASFFFPDGQQDTYSINWTHLKACGLPKGYIDP